MTLWFVNAALVLLALLFLLKPLLAKPSSHAVGKRGLERELLADRLAELERERLAGLIAKDEYEQAERETKAAYAACTDAPPRANLRTPAAAAVVVLASLTGAAVFYFYYSDGYRALLAGQEAAEVVESFEATIAALERRLAEHPQDAEARRLLAVSKYLIGDYAAAAAEYRRADALGAIKDVDDWARYADALLRSRNAGRDASSERVLAALDETLALDPQHQRALFFSGLLSFERGDSALAIERWERLLALMPPNDSGAEELRQMIIHARNPNARPEAQAATRAETQVAASSKGAADADAIRVSVSLSPALRAATSANDAVFVYARAVSGSPMPLAVERLRVSQLPAQVRLGKENAMMEGTSLGAFDRVEVVARVSKQGGARARPGDLIGVTSPVSPGQAVSVEISEIVKDETQGAGVGESDADADSIRVSVSLNPALRAAASPGDTVFVYARAVNGPPMPLAVERLRVSQLPAQVRLGKENAMMEGTSLDAFDRVEIVARVSKQGGARARPGDLIGVVSPVSPGQAVSVEISKIVE